ncbi:MAG: hypothetical protein QXX55_01760 [Candidatus Pacearchaeota archaeon]
MADRTKITIAVLVAIIIIMAVVLVYTLVLRPAISGYTISAQNQGYVIAITQIMQIASQCQPVPLTSGNVTLNLIWIDCLRQQQNQQQPSQ